MVLTYFHQKVLKHTVNMVNYLFVVVMSTCQVPVFGTFSKSSVKICSRSSSENTTTPKSEHSVIECTVLFSS